MKDPNRTMIAHYSDSSAGVFRQNRDRYARIGRMIQRPFILAFSLTGLLSLGGCDQVTEKLGVETPASKAAKVDAEGRAVGGGCRHSGRAIEDCYSIYSWLPKSSVYTGWRDMDAYMRENQLETIAPQLPPPEPPKSRARKTTPAPAPVAEASEEAATESSADTATQEKDKPARN